MAKVLIVSPEKDLSTYIALMLRNRGHQVDVWQQVIAASEVPPDVTPDLLIVSRSYVQQTPQALQTLQAAFSCPALQIDDVANSPARALIRPHLLPLPFYPELLIRRVEAALKRNTDIPALDA